MDQFWVHNRKVLGICFSVLIRFLQRTSGVVNSVTTLKCRSPFINYSVATSLKYIPRRPVLLTLSPPGWCRK